MRQTDSDNSTRTDRRTFIKGVGTAAFLLAGSGSASAYNGFSISEYSGLVRYSLPDEIERYGTNGVPGFIIGLDSEDTDALSSLESWVEDSEGRVLVNANETHNVATVAAPIQDVTTTSVDRVLSAEPLESLSYVDRVSLDVHMITPTPITTLKSRGEGVTPDSWRALYRGAWDQSSVAYREDVEPTTVQDVREAIGADSVAETGTGVTLSIIDDGVTFPDDSSLFGSRLVAAKNFVTGETGESAVESATGHGDWVAGATVASPADSAYKGICPDANFLVAKALDESGGSTSNIADAIRWSADNGADVITASLGSPVYSPELVHAVEYAKENGTKIVTVAAGNSRQTRRFIDSPADSPTDTILGVGATNTDQDPDKVRSAYFSSVGPDSGAVDASYGETRGEGVDVSAPGMQIEVQTTSGKSVLSGTSMATPIVAGALTLVLDSDASLSIEDLRTRVEDYSQPVKQCGMTEVGAGQIDVAAMISESESETTQTDTRTRTAQNRDTANRALSGNIRRFDFLGW